MAILLHIIKGYEPKIDPKLFLNQNFWFIPKNYKFMFS